MENTNQYILAKAKEAGICQEWADKLAITTDIDILLQMYIDGIDFCLEKNFPSMADLAVLAGTERLARYGIYIDEYVSLVNPKTLVLLGGCEADISIGSYQVSQIFVKHKSSGTFRISGNAFVVIDCFDDSELTVEASGDSKVLVNVYGRAKITHTTIEDARIKIVNKHKSTY